MSRINNYIFAIIVLLSFNVSSQNSIDEDPETIQNDINYRISQAQSDIKNYDYLTANRSILFIYEYLIL